jgi:hypothetical protein
MALASSMRTLANSFEMRLRSRNTANFRTLGFVNSPPRLQPFGNRRPRSGLPRSKAYFGIARTRCRTSSIVVAPHAAGCRAECKRFLSILESFCPLFCCVISVVGKTRAGRSSFPGTSRWAESRWSAAIQRMRTIGNKSTRLCVSIARRIARRTAYAVENSESSIEAQMQLCESRNT